jgi:hypothetical protein
MAVDRNVIREFFLRGNPNPTREGCPGHAVLQAIAENTLPLNDPARLHLASCSPCFQEFRVLKEHYELRTAGSRVRQQRIIAVLAIAAGLVVAVLWLGGGSPFSPFQTKEVALAERTINLWDRGTVRGEEQGDMNVTLPKSRIKLHVILPRLSESGRYTIGIAHDRFGKNLVEGAAIAVASGPQESVIVTLDLRSIERGVYFLSTTREAEKASYYYPVTIT